MSIVGITPNLDADDILDEQEEMEIGPELQTPAFSHYLLGFVRDPMWVPVWRRNRGPRAFRDYDDPAYDKEFDPRSKYIRDQNVEHPQWNFPIEKLPEKMKELESVDEIEITPEMQDRWYRKYGNRWKEAATWLYAYEREDPNPPVDPRSSYEKKHLQRERERAKSYTDFVVERLKMTKQSKKQIQQELENTSQDLSPLEQTELLRKHVLPPIKEQELIERGIMDKQDSFDDENTAFFPWVRQKQVLKNMQKEFDKSLLLHKQDQLTSAGPHPKHLYDKVDIGQVNPYPQLAETELHAKCGHTLNGLKLCKIISDERGTPRSSCDDAAATLISCISHQFCYNEQWMLQRECKRGVGTTRLCEVSKSRMAACLAKTMPANSDMEL